MTKKQSKKPKVELRYDAGQLCSDCHKQDRCTLYAGGTRFDGALVANCVECGVLGCEVFNRIFTLPAKPMLKALGTIPEDCPLPTPAQKL